MTVKRRTFIQTSCNFCLFGAAGILLSELEGCSPSYQVIKSEITHDTVQIGLASFAQSNLQFVRPKGWYYDIAVQKKENVYEALLLQCTHQNNQLIPAGNGFVCNLHGSQFDRDGNPTKGPAENPLKKFSTSVDQDNLIIHLKAMDLVRE